MERRGRTLPPEGRAGVGLGGLLAVPSVLTYNPPARGHEAPPPGPLDRGGAAVALVAGRRSSSAARRAVVAGRREPCGLRAGGQHDWKDEGPWGTGLMPREGHLPGHTL
mmetsp:Transcript_71866/g.222885  ORF Transcript_71866/g.222885 Transcript_71866/m.222885 type:complete len:109 (+) Transcript_71866:54-380(+)